MQILVNGRPEPAAVGVTLAQLVESLQVAGKRLAIERNGEIVPRSAWGTTVLDDGDRVEIVHAIGGG